jgi:hypothetical protein
VKYKIQKIKLKDKKKPPKKLHIQKKSNDPGHGRFIKGEK